MVDRCATGCAANDAPPTLIRDRLVGSSVDRLELRLSTLPPSLVLASLS